MSPDFKEGDFVLLLRVPFLFRFLKPGNVIAFEHGLYGALIKRIRSLDPIKQEVVVEGVQANSLDSRRLGPIRRQAIRGKVIAHIAKT